MGHLVYMGHIVYAYIGSYGFSGTYGSNGTFEASGSYVLWVIVVSSVSCQSHPTTTPDVSSHKSAQLGYPWLAAHHVGYHPGVWKSGLYPGEQFGVHVIPSQVTDIASDVLKVLTSMTIDTAVENIFTHALCYIL